ncbi:MAG: T9SS type A sorting domain-containing protein [Saprospiraceae bacterium]|nr:T9SS type A sorting domain-containing protein [Saprospiraceae bacterium]
MLTLIPQPALIKRASVLILILFSIIGTLRAQAPEILYYKFDGTGTSVPNEASNPPLGTETATILGDLTQGSGGKCAGGLIGTGSTSSSNYVNTNWVPNLNGVDWSIHFWINNVSNYSLLWYIFGDVNANSFRCFTNGVAGPDNYWLRGGGLTDIPVNGGAAAGLQHIVFVYESANNQVKAYLNGVLVNTVAQGAVNITGTGPFKVGGYSTNSSLAPGSIMDEFGFYSRALSASEVLELYEAGCLQCYTDADGDGFGDPNSEPIEPSENTCPIGYVDNNNDCNDSDENVLGISTWYLDADNDGFYFGDSIVSCNSPGVGYTDAEGLQAGDCDDNNENIYPGAPVNFCNGLDNDCDGMIDSEIVEASDCGTFIGFSPFQDSLWVIDTINSFEIITRAAPFIQGFTVTGINGASMNPINDSIYVICKVSGVSGRVLGTIDVETFEITTKGNLGDNFSSITFAPDGTLYGVTGDGASVPESLYEIDPSNASKTLLTALGNGADGEVICYNPDDNHIYHWSGNSTNVYEKINAVPPYTVTGIPGSYTGGEVFGAAYVGNGRFLTSNISSAFSYYEVAGMQSAIFGSNPDDLRGLPFINCDVQCYADADGDGYGDASQPAIFSGNCPEGYVSNNGDCNDNPLANGAVMNPCAAEVCDGLDNDCNGQIDDDAENASGWTQTDIGQSSGDSEFPICSSEGGDTISISANGYSTSTVDGMQLVHQEICGDGSITAHIGQMTGLGWAGITFRETSAPGSKKVVLKMQMNGNIRREIRSTTNGATQFLSMFRNGHTWLRIVRQANNFTGFTSTNGSTWVFAFTANVSMSNCVLVGLQVESINQSSTTTASFDHVIITGDKPTVITRPGIENGLPTQSLTIFPNPSNGDLFFSNNEKNVDHLNFILSDIHGRNVFNQEFEGLGTGNHALSLPGLADGIYLMQIWSKHELIQTNKIVILNKGL